MPKPTEACTRPVARRRGGLEEPVPSWRNALVAERRRRWPGACGRMQTASSRGSLLPVVSLPCWEVNCHLPLPPNGAMESSDMGLTARFIKAPRRGLLS